MVKVVVDLKKKCRFRVLIFDEKVFKENLIRWKKCEVICAIQMQKM